ncbi:PDGLE domain-containing protein [Lachnospiraceae bacterium MD1]|uniref:PDGLE domain-containing protein n=2 Tax=Variimorphobacter saccharofermentans TaxID=2755051 RepID=A0A839K2B3_9FIRM|nr:energy-coupling factor ABC transporter permease [Variimorphobacter saccharofermentans]MBB2182831.1 PDGLE domain-containing protein [Variimorphobacter saccharofermentans]
MHMSDALVSVAVGGSMTAVSTGAIGYSIRKLRITDTEDKKIPMMGVMGAFIFAGQMINFTIPVVGSSGHIGGGILLAALLGPYPALITLASVLLVQCLFFADGGLLALGCNIFNMGVIPCLLVYPLIYKPILKRKISSRRITTASILAVVAGLQLGAFAVVLETVLSGISEIPFREFILFMQPIHLAIGIVEGIITSAVLIFVYHLRQDMLELDFGVTSKDSISRNKVIIIFLLASLLIGGGLSLYASTKPDGLEWSIEKVTEQTELVSKGEIHAATEKVQEATSIMPDYSFSSEEMSDSPIGTSLSGIIGGLITLIMAVSIGIVIMMYKRVRRSRTMTEG